MERERSKEIQLENDEVKKLLNEKDGFKDLESTVIELSNLLVSKKN